MTEVEEHPVPTPAKEPTAAEMAKERDRAQMVHERVVKAMGNLHGSLWGLAEWLYKANESKVWLMLGYDTQNEWLAQPEIHLKRSTFQRLVRVWDETVVKRGLKRPALAVLDPWKVDLVLPAVNKARVSLEEALADAENLGGHDLRAKYRGIKSPLEDDTDKDGGPVSGEVVNDGPLVGEADADDALGAIVAAWEELREAYDSGAAKPRVSRDTVSWLLLDDHCRPARDAEVIAHELTELQNVDNGAGE